MAGDDDILDPEDLEEIEEVDDAEELEIDPDLDEDVLEEELEEDLEDDVVDEFEDFDEAEEGDDTSGAAGTGPARRSVSEDEDDDDEMLAPDDVEADLDTILKDRLEAADEEANEEEDEPEERGESADRLQPKRADEQLCPSCFLLVRQSAPSCPVGDDECPLFR